MNEQIARYLALLRRSLRLLAQNRPKYAAHRRLEPEPVSLIEVVAKLEGAVVSVISKKYVPSAPAGKANKTLNP